MSPRFILIWNDEHDADRNVRRVAHSVEQAVRRVHDFLDHETVYDEEMAAPEFYEDSLKPAFQAFLDDVAGDELTAFLTGMRIGESAELPCEGGTFEICRAC